jgi:hypothetical protein
VAEHCDSLPDASVTATAATGHHLHGIHKGYILASARAPDQLVWELGVRPGKEPLMVFGR